MRPRVTMRQALSDRALLGDVLAGDSWHVWRTLLIAAMGEALTDEERETFTQLTGREREPLQRVEEFVGVIGRRGGKSRAVAVLACYIAGLCDHRDVLVAGERGTVLCCAPDQRQATITLDYATAVFEQSKMLRTLIASRTQDELTLKNGVSLQVRAANFRHLRGATFLAVLADEAAYWHTEEHSANADAAILTAVRPGLSTTRGLLAIISSPHARRGELWSLFRRHYGPDGDPLILVAQAPSRVCNPTLAQSVVDRALERDRDATSAEYLAQFRSDLEAFVSREAVENVIDVGARERAPVACMHYCAFIDPAGGSGTDSMTMAISHCEGEVKVLDAIYERRPSFSPESVVADFSEVLKRYKISRAEGDRFGGEWVAESFRRHHISYELAAKSKSDLYRDLLPAINSRQVRLLDHDRLVAQLCSLERRTTRGTGRDVIDHPPGSGFHDDVANACAGALVAAEPLDSLDWIGDGDLSRMRWSGWNSGWNHPVILANLPHLRMRW